MRRSSSTPAASSEPSSFTDRQYVFLRFARVFFFRGNLSPLSQRNATTHALAQSFETRKESTSAAKQSVSDLKQFVLKNAVPLAGVYDSDNAKTYAQLGLPRLVVWSAVDRIKAPKQIDYYVNRLRKVAKDFVGKLAVRTYVESVVCVCV
jgi:hypothetical protein